jgi:hypothetical protein
MQQLLMEGMGDYLRVISRVSVYLALHYIFNIV